MKGPGIKLLGWQRLDCNKIVSFFKIQIKSPIRYGGFCMLSIAISYLPLLRAPDIAFFTFALASASASASSFSSGSKPGENSSGRSGAGGMGYFFLGSC